jgi:hypothetical protein
MNFIICDPFTENHTFFVNSLNLYLLELGHQSIIIKELKQNNILLNNEIFILFLNPYYLKDKNIKNKINEVSKFYKYKILYITEPIYYEIENKVYIELIHIFNPYCLWTYTYNNLNKLRIVQNIFKIEPVYNDSYYFINLESNKRITDKIVFIGNINDSRKIILDQFENKLVHIDNIWTKNEWISLLNKYLFYINIHRRNECLCFETLRCFPILANGGIVFSERSNMLDEEEYKEYNIIFCEKEDIVSRIHTFLENKNINYKDIYEKTMKFRKDKAQSTKLIEYIEFHHKL